MGQSVVVCIPARSPVLERFARAVAEGAAHEAGRATVGIELVEPEGGPFATPRAPLVILGWDPEVESSRAHALATLSQLHAPRSSVRQVVCFEVSTAALGARGTPHAVQSNLKDDDDSRMAGRPERFTFEGSPNMSRGTEEELARARRWGAEIVLRYRMKFRQQTLSAPPTDSLAPESRSVPWCGATE
jgi:hypothetical protein